MSLDIGNRIRKLRRHRDLVIDDLAKTTGLSRAYISQVETGKASPSIQTLEKLADALDIPISYFFMDESFTCHVVPKDERQVIYYGAPNGPDSQKKRINFLSAPNRQLEMVLLEIPVGYVASGRNHSHDGEECHLVLEGTIKATQGEKSFILKEGDSYHWDGSIPHRVENAGNVPAKLLVARTPPGFLSLRFFEASDDKATLPRELSAAE